MKYKEYKNLDYAKVGESVLSYWKENKIFEQSVSFREGKPSFTFYEGPPSANGTPGIHHVMARTIKDIFCRYKTLQGFQVKRKGGWDTHGLPIELQVEKELGITKDDIGKTISIEAYNQKCREAVMKYTGQWNDLTEKMGYWVDLEHPYITYQTEYIESIWHLLKKLYEKGLLYKGYTIQPYSPSDGTGLSSHELNQPGCYKEVKDTSIVAQFKVSRDSKSEFLFTKPTGDVFILAWTTTPWTLPSNTALAIGERISYVQVNTFNPYTYKPVSVVLAKELVGKYFSEKNKDLKLENYKPGDKAIPFELVQEFTGKQLIGIRYEQLMPYLQPFYNADKAFQVIAGDFVTTEDGTGVVHTSPTFGADDFRVAKQHGIPALTIPDEVGNELPTVDKKGKFISLIGMKLQEGVEKYKIKTHKPLGPDDFYVKNYTNEDESHPDYKTTDVIISIILKEENKAFKVEKYEHTYPHSWRTDKPVLYYPLDAWFIKTTAVKDRLVELNKTINWKPESTGSGRFGNWLENLVDWNLSRSRYWGTPLPIWRTESINSINNKEICVGSLKEFESEGWYYFGGEKFELLRKKINDLSGRIAEYREDNLTEEQNSLINNLFPSSSEVAFLKVQLLAETDLLPKDFEKHNVNIEYVLKYLTPLNEIIKTLDLHRPYVDRIAFIKDLHGKELILGSPFAIYSRETDLIDVWFDSGAMPYAQWHYPFENQEVFKNSYPADFISEGVDQTRGWFFTLHAIAGMLFDSVAFKNVVSTGLVLDKNGNKMSKRVGNVVNPFDTLNTYGPDATRWYMVVNAPPWDNLKFNLEGVTEVQRRFFGTLHNTYSFFALYANLDQFSFAEKDVSLEKRTESDRWIISKLNSLVQKTAEAYDEYEPTRAARAIQDFVTDDLSNWYVRLNRKRFWKGEYNEDKIAAYQTLYTCLETIAKLMSPIAPFYAEQLFLDLNKVSKREQVPSVHVSEFPKVDTTAINVNLEEKMTLAQNISSLVHSLRKKHTIKVRQPLSRILIPVLQPKVKAQIQDVEDLILSEVNIKQVEYIDDTSGILVKKIKPNFKKLGKEYGPRMKEIAGLIQAFGQEEIKVLEREKTLPVSLNGQTVNLTLEDVEISSEDIPGWIVASENGLTVALDITITDDLRKEGISRDVVNRVQNLRKDMGLEVQDKIKIDVQLSSTLVNAALEANKEYICAETQALELNLVESVEGASAVEMDEFMLNLKITVVN